MCGASRGIGWATARQLAMAGAQILALARSEAELEKLCADLPKHPKGHRYFACDLQDLAKLKAQMQQELQAEGPIEVLINNTGGPAPGPITTADPEDFVKAFRQHIASAQVLTQMLLSGMKQQGYGRIVNVISTSVKIPIPNLGVSNTVRAAMANWSKTMSQEVAPFGITVNNVLPGYTTTERFESLVQNAAKNAGVTADEIRRRWLATIPAARFAKPAEIAQAILFLASPMAAYINGINLPVDGGRTGSL